MLAKSSFVVHNTHLHSRIDRCLYRLFYAMSNIELRQNVVLAEFSFCLLLLIFIPVVCGFTEDIRLTIKLMFVSRLFSGFHNDMKVEK